ncbi:cell division ATP-binding protein FtsE [Thermoanaerobacterium thermosaccharolyticum]|jgi:cell division transport system ATP-binding protein|uniref:Cell division ATP-binding protein FtsE n=3 Tax=Thermoanaerobacterium thermosaccharolyticum TaxID=1517 RepID=D9TT39_THETC|nr:cell division ATP-binding protein FtsE [Thermoanaerobacterium thermosaccharolyticum]ADL68181.1 cell division ATP-binding protein FtsE [Thermoanaerobacterium thermosaccharolyticum DSM 571]AGB18307.1 cell division ATP-binding protein FtsE [Thermoanaerobacterium thermosaccharolyticum M0795]AST58179.1 cell division ATP-binding protein [Thermoanaerobacterium thermosaccharolyticum]KAA5808465.1 cell division ATP-binding protein FtsE [Thermoanaerobacterium thermosaccharolyticum]MBE0068402.1 cell di
MIKFVGVSKKYKNEIIAVSNINFTIDNGEFVFLVGPSGAGKSTILKLLLREEIPTTGSIFVDKKDITKLKRRDVPYLRRNIGVVFQDFKLLPNKTVYENIAFALQIVEAEPKYIRRRVPMVLSLVGLSDRANSYPQQLSGGEQQRVSIARAIVNEPSILVADEPTGNLDPDTSWEIVKLLSEINKRGTTVIMSTHAKDIVDSMKKRVIALEKGNIVRDEMRGAYGYEA